MAIYEQGYRPYLGPREHHSKRPFVIALSAFRSAWRRRGVKIIFLGALAVLLGAAVFLYLGWRVFAAVASKPREPDGFHGSSVMDIIKSTPEEGFAMIYQGALLYEGIWVFILALAVLCGLIAHDRRTGAIPLYLTRAISRQQYLQGKLLASVGLCALLLVVPSFVMGLLDFGFSISGMGMDAIIRGGAAMLVGLLWSILIGTTVVAISTLTARPRLAAVYCAAAAFIPMIGVGILTEMFHGEPIFSILSPLILALHTAEDLFGMEKGFFGLGIPSLEAPASTILVLFWSLFLFLFARWRIRVLGDVRE